jgi:hypothetical protein
MHAPTLGERFILKRIYLKFYKKESMEILMDCIKIYNPYR